jgi:hypothetical protein
LLSVQLTTSISNRDMYVLLESHLFENMDLMNNILYSRHFQVESQPSGRSTVVVCCELFSPLLSGFILKSPKNNIPKEAAERWLTSRFLGCFKLPVATCTAKNGDNPATRSLKIGIWRKKTETAIVSGPHTRTEIKLKSSEIKMINNPVAIPASLIHRLSHFPLLRLSCQRCL